MNTSAQWSDGLQYLASFVLVVALLLGLLWALRKLQLSPSFSRRDQRLQVVESMSVGTRQKIALLRCDDQEILVGITAGQITALAQWPSKATPASPAAQAFQAAMNQAQPGAPESQS